MMRYSIGLATYQDNADHYIILIQKQKPDWQKGKLNFVGGKIEEGETPLECVAREFYEETGILTDEDDWLYLGRMFRQDDFECFVYKIHDANGRKNLHLVNTTTEEQIIVLPLEEFLNGDYPLMSNLKYFYEFGNSLDFAEYECSFDIEYPPSERKDLS